MTTVQALVVLAIATVAVTATAEHPPKWRLLGENQFATVYVEPTLYEQPGVRGFFVHIRIDNKLKTNLSVDLRKSPRIFYANQWGFHDKARRESIDERRIPPVKLDADLQERLLADFHAGALTEITRSVDYYSQFDGPGPNRPENADAGSAHFLIISMDGQLFFTDGQVVTDIALANERAAMTAMRDLVIDLPVEWKPLPPEARVVR
jgi:hypothetical protein